MNKKLFVEAIAKFVLGVVLLGALLFLPAGTFNYPNAYLFLGLLFVPMFAVGIVMMLKNPDLLRKRLDAKEKQGEQKVVLLLAGLMFVCGFVVAGLDFRFGWLTVPKAVVWVASALFVISYILYGEVMRENAYLSRTIKVEENQKVVDTGLYGIVRHPMYAVTLILFLSIPLVLGSLVAFPIFCAYPFIIVKRIKNEEEVLTKELPGYDEYKKKVRYRLIPFIW